MKVILLAILLAQSEPDLKRVREVLDEAEKIAGMIGDSHLRSQPLRQIATVRGAARDVVGALKTLESIPESYDQALGYAETAKALATAGDPEGARRIVKLGMKACDAGEKDFRTGSAVGHLVVALAEAGDLEGAIKLLEGVPAGPTGQGFAVTAVGFVLAKKGKIEKAIELLRNVEDSVYVQGIEAIVKEADPASALPLVKQIGAVQYQGKALEAIVHEQFKRGTIDEAVALARTIEEPGYRASALIWLADGLRKSKPDQASGLRALARSSVDAIDGPYGRCYWWSELARSWGRAGKPETAARFAELAQAALGEIEVEWQRRESVEKVAAAVAASGNLAKAREIAASDPKAESEEILAEIARTQIEAGDFNGARMTVESCKPLHRTQILYEMGLREIKPEEARQRLVEAAALMESIDARPKSLNDIRNGSPTNELLFKLLQELEKAGEFDVSLKVARKIHQEIGPMVGAFALRAAAAGQAEGGKMEEALVWIRKIDEALPRSLALTGAAEGALKRAKR